MGETWETGSGTAQIAAIAVVSTLVLMAAILPFLIWSLLGGKGKFHISHNLYKIYVLFHLRSFENSQVLHV